MVAPPSVRDSLRLQDRVDRRAEEALRLAAQRHSRHSQQRSSFKAQPPRSTEHTRGKKASSQVHDAYNTTLTPASSQQGPLEDGEISSDDAVDHDEALHLSSCSRSKQSLSGLDGGIRSAKPHGDLHSSSPRLRDGGCGCRHVVAGHDSSSSSSSSSSSRKGHLTKPTNHVVRFLDQEKKDPHDAGDATPIEVLRAQEDMSRLSSILSLIDAQLHNSTEEHGGDHDAESDSESDRPFAFDAVESNGSRDCGDPHDTVAPHSTKEATDRAGPSLPLPRRNPTTANASPRASPLSRLPQTAGNGSAAARWLVPQDSSEAHWQRNERGGRRRTMSRTRQQQRVPSEPVISATEEHRSSSYRLRKRYQRPTNLRGVRQSKASSIGESIKRGEELERSSEGERGQEGVEKAEEVEKKDEEAYHALVHQCGSTARSLIMALKEVFEVEHIVGSRIGDAPTSQVAEKIFEDLLHVMSALDFASDGTIDVEDVATKNLVELCKKHAEKISSLEHQLQRHLQSSIKKADLKSIKSVLQRVQHDVDHVADENTRLRAHCKALRHAGTEVEERLQATMRTAARDIAIVVKQNDELLTLTETYRKEKSALEQDIANLKVQTRTLEEALRVTKLSLSQRDAEIKNLSKSAAYQLNAMQEIDVSVARLQQENEDLKLQLVSAQREAVERRPSPPVPLRTTHEQRRPHVAKDERPETFQRSPDANRRSAEKLSANNPTSTTSSSSSVSSSLPTSHRGTMEAQNRATSVAEKVTAQSSELSYLDAEIAALQSSLSSLMRRAEIS